MKMLYTILDDDSYHINTVFDMPGQFFQSDVLEFSSEFNGSVDFECK